METSRLLASTGDVSRAASPLRLTFYYNYYTGNNIPRYGHLNAFTTSIINSVVMYIPLDKIYVTPKTALNLSYTEQDAVIT